MGRSVPGLRRWLLSGAVLIVAAGGAFTALFLLERTHFTVINQSKVRLTGVALVAGGDGCRIGDLAPDQAGGCFVDPERDDAALLLFGGADGRQRTFALETYVTPGGGGRVRVRVQGEAAERVTVE